MIKRIDRQQHWSDIDLEIIDAANELHRRLSKLDPDDRRRWAAELVAARDRVFAAFVLLQDELGVSPQGKPVAVSHQAGSPAQVVSLDSRRKPLN